MTLTIAADIHTAWGETKATAHVVHNPGPSKECPECGAQVRFAKGRWEHTGRARHLNAEQVVEKAVKLKFTYRKNVIRRQIDTPYKKHRERVVGLEKPVVAERWREGTLVFQSTYWPGERVPGGEWSLFRELEKLDYLCLGQTRSQRVIVGPALVRSFYYRVLATEGELKAHEERVAELKAHEERVAEFFAELGRVFAGAETSTRKGMEALGFVFREPPLHIGPKMAPDLTPKDLAEHEKRVERFCSEAQAADPSLYAAVCARYPVQSKFQLERRRLRETYLYVNTQTGPNPRRWTATKAVSELGVDRKPRRRPLHERTDKRLSENQPQRSPGRQAEDFFGSLNPGPCSASETIALALREGHTEPTIYRARARLGIHYHRDGKAGPMSWVIPDLGQRLSSYEPLTPNELEFNRNQRIRTKGRRTTKNDNL